MTEFGVLTRLLILAPILLWIGACSPMGDSPADEERDPHYLAGKSRMNSMDYDGAIAAFENALISNPKSAAAHFELGLLYEERKTNHAAAIYHFERHLELRPDSNMAETIRQHEMACKLELAKSVSFLLVNRQVQDELRKLNATNSALHDQVEQLKAQLVEQTASYSNKLALAAQAAAQFQSQLQTQTQLQLQAQRQSPPASEPDRRSSAPVRQLPTAAEHAVPRPAAFPRTHVVKPGETLAAIAKNCRIKLSALQTANPSVEARKLRVGQTLNLPPLKN